MKKAIISIISLIYSAAFIASILNVKPGDYDKLKSVVSSKSANVVALSSGVTTVQADEQIRDDAISCPYLGQKGTPSGSAVNNTYAQILFQDPEVVETFVDDGGVFWVCDPDSILKMYSVSDGDEPPMLEGYSLEGYFRATPSRDNHGYGDYYISLVDNHDPNTVTHELGHYIDTKLGVASSTKAFNAIYEEEAEQSGFDEYCTSTASEYFAQSYSAYYNTSDFSIRCPKTYEFINTCVETFKEEA